MINTKNDKLQKKVRGNTHEIKINFGKYTKEDVYETDRLRMQQ